MNRTWLLTSLVCATLISCAAYCAEPSNVKQQSVFLRDVPQELSQQAKERLEGCKKAFAVPEEAAAEVRKVITTLDLRDSASLKALYGKMLEVGPGAIPAAEELLRSQDDFTREKAVFALRCLIRNTENTSKESTPSEALLVTLFRRSTLDRSSKVRLTAAVGLQKLAFGRSGQVHTDALAGLRDASEDPYPKVRDFAKKIIEILDSFPAESEKGNSVR